MPTKDAIQRTKSKGTTTKARGKPKAKRGAGRPRAIIDWAKVDTYLKAGCTGTGIAGMLGISVDTLYNACVRDNKTDFSAYSQSQRAVGDDMIRAKQFDLAMRGSENMLKWVGKHRLGQTDKPQDADANPNGPKNITFTITEELIENQYDERETTESGD